MVDLLPWVMGCQRDWGGGFADMGNGFANRCGGVVVSEIRVMGF